MVASTPSIKLENFFILMLLCLVFVPPAGTPLLPFITVLSTEVHPLLSNHYVQETLEC